MTTITVLSFVSLDGVVQAPSYPDEDTTGEFGHGGWHSRYLEQRSMRWVLENLAEADGFLFGRRTYDSFAAHWPGAGPAEKPLADHFNTKPKHVVSQTLREPLGWEHSHLVDGGNVRESLTRLVQENLGALYVLGSTRVVHELSAADLVDEYRLMVDPIILGGGKRLFDSTGPSRALSLADHHVVDTGAMLLRYVRSNARNPSHR